MTIEAEDVVVVVQVRCVLQRSSQSAEHGRNNRRRTVEDGALLNTKLADARGEPEEGEADDVREEGHGGGRRGWSGAQTAVRACGGPGSSEGGFLCDKWGLAT